MVLVEPGAYFLIGNKYLNVMNKPMSIPINDVTEANAL